MARKDLFGEEISAPPKMDRDALAAFLYNHLKDMSLDTFAHLITNEIEIVLEYFDLCQGGKTGGRISLLFNPHRLNIGTRAMGSIYAAISTEKFCSGLARVLIWKHGTVPFSNQLYSSLAIHVDGRNFIGEFNPHTARDVYLKHSPVNLPKILDPCGGWGGRMIGASIVSDSYTCFEPASLTVKGLLKLEKFIQRFRPTFKANIHCIPFEEAKLTPATYDIALTSPPYFDTELYSDEETNSCNRYKSFEEWEKGFYHPLIDNTMRALKPGAPFIMNIGSRAYPLEESLHNRAKTKGYDVQTLGNLLPGGHSAGMGKKTRGEGFYLITDSTFAECSKRRTIFPSKIKGGMK